MIYPTLFMCVFTHAHTNKTEMHFCVTLSLVKTGKIGGRSVTWFGHLRSVRLSTFTHYIE